MRTAIVALATSLAALLLVDHSARAVASPPGIETRLVVDGELREALKAERDDRMAVSDDTSDGVGRKRDRLMKIMRAFGYLDAEVKVDPAVLTPLPGDVYHLGVVSLNGVSGADLDAASMNRLLDIARSAPGQTARADNLARLESQVTDVLKDGGYPFVHIAHRTMKRAGWPLLASLSLDFETGPQATFGPVVFENLSTTRADTLRGYATFSEGDPFSVKLVTQFQERLMQTRLFSSVSIELADSPKPDGKLPIIVEAREKTPTPELHSASGVAGFASFCMSLLLVSAVQIAAVTRCGTWLQRSLLGLTAISLPVTAAFAFHRIMEIF
jgi:outer membrane translocation and assembly module TamA